MILIKSRIILLAAAMAFLSAGSCLAAPVMIRFTAAIDTGNSIDAADIFGEGAGADLAGQIVSGAVTIDPAALTALSVSGGASYGDFAAGAISVTFVLNGVTSTVVSTGTLGYFGDRSGGALSVSSLGNGGNNYFAVGATSADGMVQQSMGALFDLAVLFEASADPDAAVASLAAIGNGAGLVKGGITYMNPIEHLDATILTIEIPEPREIIWFGPALILLIAARRAFPG
jgi:hypothetical protein